MGNENLADYLKQVISERIENLRVYKHKIERGLNCDNEYRAETPTSCFQTYIAHWRIGESWLDLKRFCRTFKIGN